MLVRRQVCSANQSPVFRFWRTIGFAGRASLVPFSLGSMRCFAQKTAGAVDLTDLGGTMFASSPADYAKLIADETDKWAKVVKFAGIKPE